MQLCVIYTIITFSHNNFYISTAFFLLLTVVDCGQLPSLANGQVSLIGTVFGSTATYSCGVGFNAVGNTIRTCQANGQWSGIAPTCEGSILYPPQYSICLSCPQLNNMHGAQYSLDSGECSLSKRVTSCIQWLVFSATKTLHVVPDIIIMCGSHK